MITFGYQRAREVRTITSFFVAIGAIGCASAVVPAVEQTVTAVFIAIAVFAMAIAAIRYAARRIREHFEDRADARTAAAWRAEHQRVTVRQMVS